MDMKRIVDELARLRAEVDTLRRSNSAKRMPLAEANIVVDENAVETIGSADTVSTATYVPYYIDGNDDTLQPHKDPGGNDRTVTVYSLAGASGLFQLTARLPDGKRVLLKNGSPLVHAFSPSGGIPAMSGLVMGSAVCTVYEDNGSGTLVSTATTRTFFNPSGLPIDGSAHIVAAENEAGNLVVLVEACDEAGT